MTNIYKGLIWAGAILLNALGNYFGLIEDDTAGTMFVLLPVLAVLSLNGGTQCLPRRREA